MWVDERREGWTNRKGVGKDQEGGRHIGERSSRKRWKSREDRERVRERKGRGTEHEGVEGTWKGPNVIG